MLAAISYNPLVDIELGPLSISPHGLGIALGFVAGARLMLPEAARKGISEDDVYPLLVRAAIGSIIGARLAYVVNHLNDYDSAVDVLKVWQGGISLLGGFFGAILLALPEMRRRGISFWKQMDASAPGMALGVVIGRIGDLVVGDHLGKVTSLPFGYRCPPAHVDTASPCLPGTVVHQTALYDLVLTAVLLAVLLFLRRRPRYDGFLIILFALWYGLQRIGEDFLREDVRHLGLTGSQITSVVTVAVCAAWLLFGRRTPRWGRWDEPGPEREPVTVTEVVTGGAEASAGATEAGPPQPPPPAPEPP
ncbi:MAG TPA: prolipoprotein diacylglyceryl transferase, partial [Acidimicrobiales bacterium]|nr:prolipoprotein diacylglyceryl transferase [Acidimicrobiales bacterium]